MPAGFDARLAVAASTDDNGVVVKSSSESNHGSSSMTLDYRRDPCPMASSPPPLTEPGRSGPEKRRHPGIALAVLAGVWVAFAVLFFHVVRPLALPLFLAAVFAILALPAHERLTAWCGRRDWLSALLIVFSLILLLLGPITAGFIASYGRASEILARFEHTVVIPDQVDDLLDRIALLLQRHPDDLRRQVAEAIRDGEQLLFSRAVQAVGGVFSFGLGLLLFGVSAFFFLKDGRSIMKSWEQLTPLTLEQDRQVRRQFAVVCRAVVLSTILAAVAQGLALGLGLGVLDLCFGLGLGKWLVLVVVLTFVCSMIPMVGPAVIWVPLAAWMIYERQYAAGIILVAIGVIVVSHVDNLVRIAVLHGAAGMHPLLAIVSVLGGLSQMGVLGVFVGPVVAGVFIALLRILKQELDEFAAPRSVDVHDETAMSITAHENPAS